MTRDNIIRMARDAGAQDAHSVPDGWLRAIDEALVVANIGVANLDDTYEQAKAKLNSLIDFHVDVATDPAVNGGFKPMPVEPTAEIIQALHKTFWKTETPLETPLKHESWVETYKAALAAAPEAKP